MGNDSEGGGGIIFILVIAAAVVVLVTLAVAAILSVGALYGGGKAIYNYGVAFRENVALEQPQKEQFSA